MSKPAQLALTEIHALTQALQDMDPAARRAVGCLFDWASEAAVLRARVAELEAKLAALDSPELREVGA